MLNERGTLEADLTVTKLGLTSLLGGEGSFLVVATDTAHRHVESLLKRAATEAAASDEHSGFGGFACVTDVTGSLAQINIQGPRSRALLARCTYAPRGVEPVTLQDCVHESRLLQAPVTSL